MLKVAIVGCDQGLLDLVPFFHDEKGMDLVYVRHKNTGNITNLKVPTLSDYRDLTKIENLDLVINVSNDSQVEKFLAENLCSTVEVLGGQGNRLIWSLLEERRKIREETKKSLKNYREIYKLGIKLNSAMNIQDMAETIIECATKLTSTPAGSLVIYNAQTNTMRLAGIQGFSDRFSQVKEWPVRKGGLTSYLMQQKEPIVIADVTKESSFDNPVMLEEGVRSVVAVTLVSESDKIEGILYVDDFVPRTFTEDEITEMALLGTQAAFGLQKVSLLDKLSQAKEYMEAILNNSPDMIITTDHNTNIVEFNPGSEEMLGYTKEEVINSSVERFYPDKDERRKLMEKVNEFGHVTNYETKLLTKDKKLLDISLSLSHLKDGKGKVIGTVGMSKDITRQKELELELKRSNVELEQTIEEVKKIDKMKSDFLSTVSHELRTPLTSTIGFSKMILRRFKKDIVPVIPGNENKANKSAGKIKENLEIVISEGNRLSRLINNLLDLAKIEAGKIEWNFDRCALEDVCKSAMNAVQSLAQEKKLSLKINAETDLLNISGDHDRMIQVVTNLLSNAIKFTDKGSISCSLKNMGECVEVQIIDEGVGLKQDDLPKVFEKFKQVGDTMTDRPKGTGLGLPICKEIVEAHKGKIWVESVLGKGCQFIFTIPAIKAARAITMKRPQLLQEVKDKLYGKIQSLEKGQTVLVVDDEDSIRNLVHQELEEAGYKVIEAVDGSDALSKVRKYQPDLIILDILMPVIDGFDVMTILKNNEETANIPILIYSIIEDREKGYRLGADDYLTKSGEADTLLKSVSSLITTPLNTQKKVMIIENDESVSKTLSDVLMEKGYEVVIADNGEDGLLKAQAESPDLIIIDGEISRMNNNEILKKLKEEKSTENSSIIVLTNDYTQNVKIVKQV